MATNENQEKPDATGTSDYSASKAPETREHAEERAADDVLDFRLIPGGAHGARGETGMSALHREYVPNEAADPGQADYGQVDETSRPDKEE